MRLVLPMPFWPTSTDTPESRSTVTRSYDRKSASSTRRMYILRLSCSADDGVAAELLAQRGDGLHGRGVDLTRFEPGEQRGGDDVGGHGETHGLVDGPAALTGVLRVALELAQLGVAVEGAVEQVEQPRLDDGTLAPALDRAGDVVHVLRRLEQLPALGQGLHHAVLDAVVDHLGVVTGADRAGVHEAVRAGRLERLEDRHGLGHVGRAAADHQGVAVLAAPDAAGDAAVHVPDALGGEPLGARLVVGEFGVA